MDTEQWRHCSFVTTLSRVIQWETLVPLGPLSSKSINICYIFNGFLFCFFIWSLSLSEIAKLGFQTDIPLLHSPPPHFLFFSNRSPIDCTCGRRQVENPVWIWPSKLVKAETNWREVHVEGRGGARWMMPLLIPSAEGVVRRDGGSEGLKKISAKIKKNATEWNKDECAAEPRDEYKRLPWNIHGRCESGAEC